MPKDNNDFDLDSFIKFLLSCDITETQYKQLTPTQRSWFIKEVAMTLDINTAEELMNHINYLTKENKITKVKNEVHNVYERALAKTERGYNNRGSNTFGFWVY